MKKTAYRWMALLALLCTTSGIQAQSELQEPVMVFNNKIKVIPMELRQRGKDLYIQMKVETRGSSVGGGEAVRLTPVLVSESGRTMQFPPMQINGRNEQKAYRRAEILSGAKDFTDNTVAVQSGRRLDYKQKVRYKPWMANARLDVIAEVSGCGGEWVRVGEHSLQDSLLLQQNIVPYRMDFQYSYLLPARSTKDADPMVGNAWLEFPVNRTEILPGFRGNAAELENINYMIARVTGYTDMRITGIEVSGYASPEGPTGNNVRLAKGRAESMRSYLSNRSAKLPARMYKVTDGGEDWEGLKLLVEKSQIAGKAAILGILAQPDTELRKTQLAALDGGRPYSQMLTKLYPQLRRVTCRVRYQLDETGDIGETSGQAATMDLDDMYQLALSYPRGSEAFNDVLESAARVYEQNSIAALNAASAALTRGDLSAAGKFLQHADRNQPEYGNVAGIYEALHGNYGAARKLLQRAAAAGIPEAEHNLAELQKKQDNLKAIQAASKR